MHKVFCKINKLIIVALFCWFLYPLRVFAVVEIQDQPEESTDMIKNFDDNTEQNTWIPHKSICKQTEFMDVIEKGNSFKLIALLNDGVEIDINKKDFNGQTALMSVSMTSAFYGDMELPELLLKKGANINLQDDQGNTALMLVLKQGNNDPIITSRLYYTVYVVKMLLENGADINIKNNYNQTALDYAKENDCSRCVYELENWPIINFVSERAKEEELTEDEAQDIIDELVNEKSIMENLEKLSNYHTNEEITTKELVEVLAGKIPIKNENNEISFAKSQYSGDTRELCEIYEEVIAKNPAARKNLVDIVSGSCWPMPFVPIPYNGCRYMEDAVCDKTVAAKKELIKNEWREITADTGELIISFIPVAGPPIAIVFSQLVKREFNAEELMQGAAWGTADFVGVGILKKVKNIEKAATIISKAASKIKITKSVGWKVGEDYNKLTAKGTEPVWNTVKRRFWGNEVGKTSLEQLAKECGDDAQQAAKNLERMKQGKPPQRYNRKKFNAYGDDGMESKELHHDPIPRRKGGKEIEALWPEEHAAKDDHRNIGY